MAETRKIINLWRILKSQIIVMPICPEEGTIIAYTKFVIILYFYDDPFSTYIGVVIKRNPGEDLELSKIKKAVRKIRNRFYEAVSSGILQLKENRIELSIEKIKPFFENFAQPPNAIQTFFIGEFLKMVRSGKYLTKNLLEEELDCRANFVISTIGSICQ